MKERIKIHLINFAKKIDIMPEKSKLRILYFSKVLEYLFSSFVVIYVFYLCYLKFDDLLPLSDIQKYVILETSFNYGFAFGISLGFLISLLYRFFIDIIEIKKEFSIKKW